ncbi:MAG: S8 family serine peptidase [Polyangiaceae bacterium]|nr:S8 family serine peptidase [Polyangiaceae bacterium]
MRFGLIAAVLSGTWVTPLTVSAATPVSVYAQVAPGAPAGSSTPGLGHPNGARLVRMLGAHAAKTLAPSTGLIGALVALPQGTRAQNYGLYPVAPGIGRLRATAKKIDAFATLHPELHLEVTPPLHPVLDRAGQWVKTVVARQELGADGTGIMIGIADTGVDVTHPDMIDASGHTRIAWLLDLSAKPLGTYPDLEEQFGILDDSGNLKGAVLSGDMIDARRATIQAGSCDASTGAWCAPTDNIGHGTHVAGIAASSGTPYTGMAPASNLVVVRATSDSDGVESDDLVRAVEFMFNRADAERLPLVVNLSLGSDFGPHDGTSLWEQVLASYVGPDHPGHIIIAAAGNSGSIVETPIHQSVRVTEGTIMRIPVPTLGADSGSVQVWITLHDGANMKIGLDGPDGTWIAPIASGSQNGKNTSLYNAAIIYGSDVPGSPIPAGSRGAVVLWAGAWPTGTYYITFQGSGMAELYLQGLGDAALGEPRQATFASGVRQGTINLPATHPSLIGVGCTVNRPHWTSIAGADVTMRVPVLDAAGGMPLLSPTGQIVMRSLEDGEVCWFSSAGPTATGVQKPEIAAPGAFVISAMSHSALPGIPGGIFTTSSCPRTKTGTSDNRCLQIDDEHGIAVGTSMSAPVVAGVVALLLQNDPTLTQDQVRALLQAGAHYFRGAAPFDDQSGPGEVDAVGALEALDLMHDPKLSMPAASQSWITLSSEYVPADSSMTITAIVELRTSDGAHRADLFDSSRLAAVVEIEGEPPTTTAAAPPSITRRGPGVWTYEWKPPPGLGGLHVIFGATFDGQPIVSYRALPVATDGWTADYPSHAEGSGCSMHQSHPSPRSRTPDALLEIAAITVSIVLLRRRPLKKGI